MGPDGMGFLVPAHSLGLSQVMPVTTSQASCIRCQEILRTTSSKASSLGIRSKTSLTCTLTILNAIRLGTLPYRPSRFTWSWNIEANSFMVLREELIPQPPTTMSNSNAPKRTTHLLRDRPLCQQVYIAPPGLAL